MPIESVPQPLSGLSLCKPCINRRIFEYKRMRLFLSVYSTVTASMLVAAGELYIFYKVWSVSHNSMIASM